MKPIEKKELEDNKLKMNLENIKTVEAKNNASIDLATSSNE